MKVTIDKTSPIPRYYQVKADLAEKIKGGDFLPDGRIPPERKLTDQYGVSRITIIRAVNELVREGILFREQGRGTFVIPSQKVATKIKNIDFIYYIDLPAMCKDDFYTRILNGSESHARKKNCRLFFSVAGPEYILQPDIDGLLLVGVTDNVFIRRLVKKNFPLVLVDHFVKGLALDCVVIDNLKGAGEAVSYLIKSGHRRIAFLDEIPPQGVRTLSSQERFQGYNLALKEAGLPYQKELVQKGECSLKGGYQATGKLLRINPPPSAIFAFDDRLALGAMKAVKEKGLNIPEDVSIVGFGNREIPALDYPALTTVDIAKDEIGKIAVKKLISRIDNPRIKPTKDVIPTKLIIRESSGLSLLPSGNAAQR